MKGLILKLVVLKIIQILILSQVVFAQSFDDSSNNDDAQAASEADSFGFDVDGDLDGERFSGQVRVDESGIKIKFRTDGAGSKFRQEFKGGDERYEFRERMTTSAPNFGPSYEGYDREMMLFGRLFHHIEGDMEPAQIKQYCSNMDEMADIVISKVKAKIGEISNVCNDFAGEKSECEERNTEHCSMMGQPDTSYAIDDLHKMEILSSSCPVNSDAIKGSCVARMKQHTEDRLQYVEENCEYQWESYGRQNQENCERTDTQMACDESEYIENCLDRYGAREDNSKTTCPASSSGEHSKPSCENGYLKEMHDASGCFIGYECIVNQPEQKQCAMTSEEAERLSNECSSKGGSPEKTYSDGCISEVKCNTDAQCPYTEEQAREKENACLASNGKPEIIREGNCVVRVECHMDVAGINSTTGGVIGTADYDYYKRQCYNEWQRQRQNCENMKNNCKNQDEFVSECIAREKGSAESNLANIKRQCEMDSRFQIKNMERQCAMMDSERKRCLDESSKRCEMSQGLANECREKVTEENFRNFIIREAEKRCKFMPYMEKKDYSKYDKMEVVLAVIDAIGEEEIAKISSIVENLEKKGTADGRIIFEGLINPNEFNKLKELSFIVGAKLSAPESSETAKARKESIIAGLNPEKVVEKLLELSGSDVSSEYKYIIEDKANELLEASESIDDVQESEESKGFAYKIKLFLGFAKDAEESEIKSLEMSKQRLETSISSLGKLAEEIPDDISKAILKEQVAELERQKEDLESLIEQKQKKANGLLRLFGLFG